MSSPTWHRPPAVALTAEVRWVLGRAFGPPQQPFPRRIDGRRAQELAGDLQVVERIGARVPSSILVAELGREVAHQLALSRLQVLARLRGLCDLIPELTSAATAAGIPSVLLKFAALHAGGHLLEGSRAAEDIDVLVPERDAGRLAEILTHRGFFMGERTRTDHHHLPFLRDRQGRVVEVHTRLPGFREPGKRRFAGFEALERAGALEPAPGLGGACHILRRDLMAAYAVVHGLVQHGGADLYPVSRVLADVIDVLPGDRRTPGIAVMPWIAADVSRSHLDTVLGLCERLEKGDLDGLDAPRETHPEATLLHHTLATAIDREYRYSLAIRGLFRPLIDQPALWRFLRRVQWGALPNKAQLAEVLGLPSARSVCPRLRRAHAMALLGRLPRLARAALSAARRGMSRTRATRSERTV